MTNKIIDLIGLITGLTLALIALDYFTNFIARLLL